MWLYGFFILSFEVQVFLAFTDKRYRGVSMIESVNHIGNIVNAGSYKNLPSVSAEHSASDAGRDISESSSKYIVNNNKIVFERYDRQGKLISRVPWTANTVNEKV